MFYYLSQTTNQPSISMISGPHQELFATGQKKRNSIYLCLCEYFFSTNAFFFKRVLSSNEQNKVECAFCIKKTTTTHISNQSHLNFPFYIHTNIYNNIYHFIPSFKTNQISTFSINRLQQKIFITYRSLFLLSTLLLLLLTRLSVLQSLLSLPL